MAQTDSLTKRTYKVVMEKDADSFTIEAFTLVVSDRGDITFYDSGVVAAIAAGFWRRIEPLEDENTQNALLRKMVNSRRATIKATMVEELMELDDMDATFAGRLAETLINAIYS